MESILATMSAEQEIFWTDFETRQYGPDLIENGVYNYVKGAEVLCMSYAYDDGPVKTWQPGQPFPEIGKRQIRAHNAAFERLVFWYILGMDIPLEQFYCTAAQARANCAPGSRSEEHTSELQSH